MQQTRRIPYVGLAIAATLLLTACGPATFERRSVQWEAFDANEARQQRDNVVVEIRFIRELPPSFRATVARCDQFGRVAVDRNNRPIMETVALAQRDQVWKQVAITNRTENVLRMNGVVVRLFNPAGGQYNVLTLTDLRSELMARRPCPTTEQAMALFARNVIFDRNIEVVPGTTSTFYVAFRPTTMNMTGVWKLGLYDVPVSLDPAGRPLRTTRFESRIAVREVVETFRRDSLTAEPVLLERTETGPGGTRVTSPAAAASAPPVATPAPGPAPAAAPVAPAPPPRVAAPAPAPAAVAPAAGPTAAPTTPTLSRAVIARAQTRLNALGFNAGPADGAIGARTRQAISRFQQARGLAASGQLDATTLQALGL